MTVSGYKLELDVLLKGALTSASRMDDLGFDIANALEWFANERQIPYIFERVSEESAAEIAERITDAVRRCYISDELIEERVASLGVSRAEILGSKLPDPGSTMAGDFGEILVYFYHAARLHPSIAFGPKKWRLKQDRTKPAPHSDVIHFLLPGWPTPTIRDVVVCSEVKVKSSHLNPAHQGYGEWRFSHEKWAFSALTVLPSIHNHWLEIDGHDVFA